MKNKEMLVRLRFFSINVPNFGLDFIIYKF